MGQWKSVYSLLPALPPYVIKAIARDAGVHIYNSGEDCIYVNKSYLVINSVCAGTKTIHLPFKADIYNALSDEKWFENSDTFDVSLMLGETTILRYQIP